jgi:hypothetical protein
MEKRFRFDPILINGTPIIFAFGFLLMSVPLITSGAILKLVIFLGGIAILLTLFWIALAYGTYVAVDEGKKTVYGRVFFIHGRTTQLSDVLSIEKRYGFGGLMSELFMRVRRKDGSISEPGLVSSKALRAADLKEFISIMHSLNPKIEIPTDFIK